MNELDTHLFRVLHAALSSGRWLGAMAALSAVGGGWGALAAAPLFASSRTRRLGTSLAAVLGSTAIVVWGLKQIVGRARPCASLPGVHALVFEAPTDPSFPSGHAAGSFAFAVFVAILLVRGAPPAARERVWRWLLACVVVVLACGVALSRVALGVHFPADVAAGALLGATIAAGGAALHLHLRAPRPA